MKGKLFFSHILRIVLVVVVWMWGIKTWNNFPMQIPLAFNASFKPELYGVKGKFVWIFVFLLLALWPIRAEKFDDESEDINVDLNHNVTTGRTKKYALLLSWIHTVVMCMIFVIVMMLIGKNLQQ